LERPRFFCGQLLTDRDFNKLTEWIDRKSALKRFLHGWGVVCGLDVTVDPCDCSSIRISPGYALDCCGRDLVVCDSLPLLLKDKYCSEAEDPCGSLGSPVAAAVPIVRPRTVDFAGLKMPENELTGIDVYLRYGEQLGRPQRQASSGKCSSSMDPCQYTRVTEVPEICTKAVPLAQVSIGSKDRYQTQLAAILSDLALPENGRDAEALDRYLAGAYLRNCGGIHRFSFIPQLSRIPSGFNLASLAYWLVQDWHLSFAAACVECDDSTGVPVARVWLRKYIEGGKKKCCIVYVDQAPPRRRLLDKPTLPATATTLVPYHWRTLDEKTRHMLERMGIGATELDPSKLAMADIQTLFEKAVFSASPETKIAASTVIFQGEERIALFQRIT